MHKTPEKVYINDGKQYFLKPDGSYYSTKLGSHGVKVVGWGKDENGVDFWRCMNSWGDTWGDRGTFKIRKGTNEANCETNLQVLELRG